MTAFIDTAVSQHASSLWEISASLVMDGSL